MWRKCTCDACMCIDFICFYLYFVSIHLYTSMCVYIRFLNVFIHAYIYKYIENLCNNASESWKHCWLQRGDYIAQRQWMRYLLMLVCHFVFFVFCAIVRHYLSKKSKRKDNLECWRVNRKSVERSEPLLITWVQADGEGSCTEQYSKFRNSVLFPPKGRGTMGQETRESQTNMACSKICFQLKGYLCMGWRLS